MYEKLMTNANRSGLKGQNRNTERWGWEIDSHFFFYVWLKIFDFCVISARFWYRENGENLLHGQSLM